MADVFDATVPLKDADDEQLLQELDHRNILLGEQLSRANSTTGTPVKGAWRAKPDRTTMLPPLQGRRDANLLVPIRKAASDKHVLYEFAPTRAWVDGKLQPSALKGAEQIYMHKVGGTFDQLTEENEALRAENAKLRGECDTLGLRLQYESQRGHIGQLQLKVEAENSRNQADGLSERVQVLEDELRAAAADRDRLTRLVGEHDANANAMRSELGQAVAQARSEQLAREEAARSHHSLHLTLKQAQDAAAQSAAELQSAASLRAELERVKATAKQALAGMTNQLSVNERLLALLKGQEQETATLRLEIERLTAQLRAAEGVGSGAQGQLAQLQATITALTSEKESLITRLQQLEAALAAKDGDHANRSRQHEMQLRDAMSLAEATKSDRAALEARMRDSESAFGNERDGWGRERDSLAEQLRQARAEANGLRGEKDDLERRLRESQAALSACESRLLSAEKLNKKMAAEFDELVTLTFRQIDEDMSGELDGEEVRRALNLLGLTGVSDQEIIMKSDGSKDAKIQLDEFPGVVRDMLAKMKELGISARDGVRPAKVPPPLAGRR